MRIRSTAPVYSTARMHCTLSYYTTYATGALDQPPTLSLA